MCRTCRKLWGFLLAGGAPGKRMALANSEIMIHQPAIHGNGIQGQVSDIRIMSEHVQKQAKIKLYFSREYRSYYKKK